jgi:hypothetical protein
MPIEPPTIRVARIQRNHCENPRQYLIRETGEMIWVPCGDARNCAYCARRAAEKIRDRFASIPWRISMTMTMAEGKGAPTPANIKAQSQAAGRFFGYLRRKFGREFAYGWVREGAEDRLHMHAVSTIPYVAQDESSEIAEASGFGPVLYISRVPSMAANRRGYRKIVQYMTKTLHRLRCEPQGYWPRGTRRYQLSWGRYGPRTKSPNRRQFRRNQSGKMAKGSNVLGPASEGSPRNIPNSPRE